jgi:hypothetical protein
MTKVQDIAAHEIKQSSRCADYNVGTSSKKFFLPVETLTSIDGRQTQPRMPGKQFPFAVYLQSEFTGWGKNESQGALTFSGFPGTDHSGENSNEEGGGFTRAGLGLGAYIFSL